MNQRDRRPRENPRRLTSLSPPAAFPSALGDRDAPRRSRRLHASPGVAHSAPLRSVPEDEAGAGEDKQRRLEAKLRNRLLAAYNRRRTLEDDSSSSRSTGVMKMNPRAVPEQPAAGGVGIDAIAAFEQHVDRVG